MDLLEEIDKISSEAVGEQDKAEREEKLVPVGKWPGTVFTWNKVEESDKREGDEFAGVPLYKAGITFYDCPEVGKKKTGWFKFTTHKVLNDKGNPKTAYKTAVSMTKALDMADSPFADVLEQAKVTSLVFDVAQFTPEGKDITYNYLRGVKAS